MSDELDMLKVMLGCHLMRAPGQILLQRGPVLEDGSHITTVAAILHTPELLFTPQAVEMGAQHELIVGEMLIRPAGKFASNKFAGWGIAGCLTGEAMFPRCHEVVTLDNGYPDHFRPRKGTNYPMPF
jgi:hypothetical protein